MRPGPFTSPLLLRRSPIMAATILLLALGLLALPASASAQETAAALPTIGEYAEGMDAQHRWYDSSGQPSFGSPGPVTSDFPGGKESR